MTARAKGVSEKDLEDVFRNAMLLAIAGFPATFISMFFTGSLLIEVMFSLNGLGLLGYEANRLWRLSCNCLVPCIFSP